MKALIHFDPLRIAAQTECHTARRFLYAEAVRNGETIRSFGVPGTYPRATTDVRYRVVMRQPKRSNGALTEPGKIVRINRAK